MPWRRRTQALVAVGVVGLLAVAAVIGHVVLGARYTGPPKALIAFQCPAVTVAFSPDGRTVATVGHAVYLWNATNGNQIADLPGHLNYVTSVAFSPDGRTL